jgi:hypothetical protein
MLMVSSTQLLGFFVARKDSVASLWLLGMMKRTGVMDA